MAHPPPFDPRFGVMPPSAIPPPPRGHIMPPPPHLIQFARPAAPQLMPFQGGGAHPLPHHNPNFAAAVAAAEHQRQCEIAAAAHSQMVPVHRPMMIPIPVPHPHHHHPQYTGHPHAASILFGPPPGRQIRCGGQGSSHRKSLVSPARGGTLPAIAHSPNKPLSRMPVFCNGKPELPPPKFYASVVPLGVEDDKHYLSELQCVLRKEFVEAFGTTTQMDNGQPVHGRSKPITIGQVGIRCQHCKSEKSASHWDELPISTKAPNASSYPSFISGIYNTVQQMYRLHFDHCPEIPDDLKDRVAILKDSHTSNRGGRKQYWIDSANRLGLCDTSFGIHYGRDPKDPLPPIVECNSAGDLDEDVEFGMDGNPLDDDIHPIPQPVDDSKLFPLVLPEDKELITNYLYLALDQMQPAKLMDADRVGCYKSRRTGFPGLACKHCIGQAGCGRYFPASEASLSQTTTSQTIVNHVRNCRRCPLEVREQLELMKRAKAQPAMKIVKPKHGGRKVFFRRLWCRIQHIPLPDEEEEGEEDDNDDGDDDDSNKAIANNKRTKDDQTQQSRKRGKFISPGRKRKKSADDLDDRKNSRQSTVSKYDSSDDEREVVVETVDFDGIGTTSAFSNTTRLKATIANANEVKHIIYQGRTRLSRGDDAFWLSEVDCFIRQELVEVFTVNDKDLEIYGELDIGQVGIRCSYCVDNKCPDDDRNGDCVYFPPSVAGIQSIVEDMKRRHLAHCSEIPADVRERYNSCKGYGAEGAKGATPQYWIDSARELGLQDLLESQGVNVFRNPLHLSPADEMDEEGEDEPTGSVLVQPEDRLKCTNHVFLLLRQFGACQFRTSDRKSSTNPRDRVIGFPGLVCIHCKQKRYFPITQKKLQDTISLMATHIKNCHKAPMEIKASLGYLQHRSFLQKNELAGHWKFNLYKCVWNRLHQNYSNADSSLALTDADASGTTSTFKEEMKSLSDDDSPVEVHHNIVGFNNDANKYFVEEFIDGEEVDEEEDNTEIVLSEMKDMIKAAALWLTERDAEYEERGIIYPGGNKRR